MLTALPCGCRRFRALKKQSTCATKACVAEQQQASPVAAAQGDLETTPTNVHRSFPSLPAAALVTLPLVWADSAAAATVCFDVPDWLVDWKALLFHSPVVAVGTAGLALVLFPKLIRVSKAAACMAAAYVLWCVLREPQVQQARLCAIDC